MALSRWNHSLWYIYNSGGEDNNPSLSISCCGQVSLNEIKEDIYSVVDEFVDRLGIESVSNYDKKELYLYLKYFKEYCEKELSYSEYVSRLTFLRRIGWNRFYVKYGSLPFRWKMNPIPINEKVFINERRNNFAKTGKDEYYRKEYNNDIFEIEFFNDQEFYFLDKKGHRKIIKFNKRIHRILFPNNPIIPNTKYSYCSKNKVIYNKEINTEEFKILKLKLINDKIAELEAFKAKL
jgi:hypothetical protein